MSDPRTADWLSDVRNDDAAIPKCETCKGRGEVWRRFNAGGKSEWRVCPDCGGLGVKSTRGREAKR